MSEMTSPTGSDDSWKQYPLSLGDDPQFVFPAAEGNLGAAAHRYGVSGRLAGRSNGRSFAFLLVLSADRLYGTLHSDACTFALFDLDDGTYGTSTTLDSPRLFRRRESRRLSLAEGALDVVFRGDAGATSLRTRRSDDGEILPFAYALHAEAVDADRRPMKLDLELDATKPPVPIGGKQYRGVGTWAGERDTRAYFQSALRLRGTLSWGEIDEQVAGDCGWIDHQWSARSGAWNDGRLAHRRCAIHLDDGIDVSVWTQLDRERANRIIPYSGATAAGPRGEIDATTSVRVEPLSFMRDRRGIETLRPSTGPKYFCDRLRLLVPSWDLDLLSEPIVAAPAHALARDYWNGPARVHGTLGGSAVSGFAFHERTHALTRDFEIAGVLRQSLRHVPSAAVPEAAGLADLAWEIDAMIGRGDHQSAIDYLETHIRPRINDLPEPHRAELREIADAAGDALLRWWVRPRKAAREEAEPNHAPSVDHTSRPPGSSRDARSP